MLGKKNLLVTFFVEYVFSKLHIVLFIKTDYKDGNKYDESWQTDLEKTKGFFYILIKNLPKYSGLNKILKRG